jgi:uncharacterized protein involved in exopolysaccharide biosynthesis
LILKLKEWWIYLKSKWVIILIAGIFGSAIGLTYAFFQKPTYTATLSFALEDEKTSSSGGLTSALGLASSLGFDLGTNTAGGAFSGANLMELMKSRTLVEKALLNPITVANKTTSLVEYYIEFSKLRQLLDEKIELVNLHYAVNDDRTKFSLEKDSVLGEIYKKLIGENDDGALNVSQRDKKISIINVDVKTENELFSKYESN